LTAAPQAKTEDLQMLILDNSERMDLGMGIRSAQVHLAVAHHRQNYNNNRMHVPTQLLRERKKFLIFGDAIFVIMIEKFSG